MARPVTVMIPHELGIVEARTRLRDGFGKLKSTLSGGMMFSFAETWENDDRLAFTARGMGQTIAGKIDVFPQHVRIEVMLPALLATIAETLTGKLEKQGALLLDKK